MKKQISKTWEVELLKLMRHFAFTFNVDKNTPEFIEAKEFISHLLDNQREEIVERIGGIKILPEDRYVKLDFDDRAYNQALDDIIKLIKTK